MLSILFVCTANRFRSPIASIYFAREVVRRGDDDKIRVSSAGTWAMPGQPVMPDALDIAKTYGLNLSLHKSRPISEKILHSANLVLVMTSGHKEAIEHEFPEVSDRVHLFSAVADDTNFDIPDPYAGADVPVETVIKEIFGLIDRGYENIVDLTSELKKAQSKN